MIPNYGATVLWCRTVYQVSLVHTISIMRLIILQTNAHTWLQPFSLHSAVERGFSG